MRFRGRWQVPVVLMAIAVGALVAGCQATPAAQPQAAAPAQAGLNKLFLSADMVQGSKNIPADQKESRSCVLENRFMRNSEMVWRVRVADPATGEYLDDKGLTSVQVKLANGQTFDAKYGFHPKDPPGDGFWTTSWVIPKDAPTGSMQYTIVATDAKGRTGEYKPYNVQSSLPTILNEVLADVPAKA
jgi:hypothetical protein